MAETTIRVNGKEVRIEHPDGLSNDQLNAFVQSDVLPHIKKAGDEEAMKQDENAIDLTKARKDPNRSIGDSLRMAGSNAPRSFSSAIGDLYNVISSPIKTATTMLDLAKGVQAKLSPDYEGRRANMELQQRAYMGRVPIEQVSAEMKTEAADRDKLTNDFTEGLSARYGSFAALRNTFEEDPVGIVADVFSLLGGFAGWARKAVGTTGKLSTTLSAVQKVSEAVDPIKIVFKGTGLASDLTGVSRVIDAGLEGLADKLTTTYKGFSKAQAKKITKTNIAGVEPGIWLSEHGIFGTVGSMVEQLSEVHKKSKRAVDESLDTIKSPIRSENSISILNKLTQAFKPLDLTSKSFRDARSRINELRIKSKKEGLTLSEMNETKRLLDDNLNTYSPTGDMKEGIANADLAATRDQLKTEIEKLAAENGIPNIKELNKQTQVSYGIKSAMVTNAINGSTNRILSLTDLGIMTGVGLTMSGGTAVGVLIGKKILESPVFKTSVANQLRKMTKKGITELENSIISGVPTLSTHRMMQKVYIDAAKEAGIFGVKLGAVNERVMNAESQEEMLKESAIEMHRRNRPKDFGRDAKNLMPVESP